MAGGLPRRAFLKRLGLATAGVTGAIALGVTYRAWDQGALGDIHAGPAFEPWREWSTELPSDPSTLVAAAILASNPHNSQPWLFRIRPRWVDLLADPMRHLGSIDPLRREMHMGLGCAIENMLVAARGHGYKAEPALLPDPGTETWVARIALADGPREAGDHFDAIGTRHTSRAPYERSRAVPRAALDALAAQVVHPDTRLRLVSADGPEGRLFARATIRATEDFVADAEMSRDSHRWFRHSLADVNRHRDGVTTIAVGLPDLLLRLALLLPERMIGDPGQAWVKATRDYHCPTAPMFGLIAVRRPADRRAFLEAGRLWQRLHLEGTARGLAMQPLNQLMEMAERDQVLARPSQAERDLASMVGDESFQGIFGFRFGYAKAPAGPSPRRPLKAVALA